MNKFAFIIAIIFSSFILTACGDNDDNEEIREGKTISSEGTVSGRLYLIEIGAFNYEKPGYEKSSIIKKVTNEIDKVGLYLLDSTGYVLIEESPVINGQFSLKLPTPSSGFLYNALGIFGEDAVSDKTAKVVSNIWIKGLKDDIIVGQVSRMTPDLDRDTSVGLIYSDKDLHVYIEKYLYDMNMKEGWNVVFSRDTLINGRMYTKTTTNNEPLDLIWTLNF